MTDPDSRAEFETFAQKHLLEVGDTLELRADGKYRRLEIQYAWYGWQAARRTLPQGYAAGIEAAAKVCEEMAAGYINGELERWAATTLAESIRALTPEPVASVEREAAGEQDR